MSEVLTYLSLGVILNCLVQVVHNAMRVNNVDENKSVSLIWYTCIIIEAVVMVSLKWFCSKMLILKIRAESIDLKASNWVILGANINYRERCYLAISLSEIDFLYAEQKNLEPCK